MHPLIAIFASLSFIHRVNCQSDGNASTPLVNAPEGAHCVTGATYCGYILLQNQGFDEASVRSAYCSFPGKCPDGGLLADESVWKSTLFVCLPPDAVPKAKDTTGGSHPHPHQWQQPGNRFSNHSGSRFGNHSSGRFSNHSGSRFGNHSSGRFSNHSSDSDDAAMTNKVRRQIPGVCEDAGPRKLEPLVYCAGEGAVEEICLNPEGDHIGRCRTPGNV